MAVELGVELDAFVEATSVDAIVDDLIDYAEARGLRVGGGCGPNPNQDGWNLNFVLECLTNDREVACNRKAEFFEWLEKNQHIKRFRLGSPFDLNEV